MPRMPSAHHPHIQVQCENIMTSDITPYNLDAKEAKDKGKGKAVEESATDEIDEDVIDPGVFYPILPYFYHILIIFVLYMCVCARALRTLHIQVGSGGHDTTRSIPMCNIRIICIEKQQKQNKTKSLSNIKKVNDFRLISQV